MRQNVTTRTDINALILAVILFLTDDSESYRRSPLSWDQTLEMVFMWLSRIFGVDRNALEHTNEFHEFRTIPPECSLSPASLKHFTHLTTSSFVFCQSVYSFFWYFPTEEEKFVLSRGYLSKQRLFDVSLVLLIFI